MSVQSPTCLYSQCIKTRSQDYQPLEEERVPFESAVGLRAKEQVTGVCMTMVGSGKLDFMNSKEDLKSMYGKYLSGEITLRELEMTPQIDESVKERN